MERVYYKLVERRGQWEWYVIQPNGRRDWPMLNTDLPANWRLAGCAETKELALQLGREMGWDLLAGDGESAGT